MTKQDQMEEMEVLRHRVYLDYVRAIGTDREQMLLTELDRIDAAMELLDESEIDAEDMHNVIHWDEWMMDNRIDRAREDEAV